jgi:hypothetical protein
MEMMANAVITSIVALAKGANALMLLISSLELINTVIKQRKNVSRSKVKIII